MERYIGIAAVTLVAAGVIAAFLVLGTPGHARLVALDQRRTNDLQSIVADLHQRYGAHTGNLPARLPASIMKLDPVTKKPYEYRRMRSYLYELCAVYAASSEPDAASGGDAAIDKNSFDAPHGSGRRCYLLDVAQP